MTLSFKLITIYINKSYNYHMNCFCIQECRVHKYFINIFFNSNMKVCRAKKKKIKHNTNKLVKYFIFQFQILTFDY